MTALALALAAAPLGAGFAARFGRVQRLRAQPVGQQQPGRAEQRALHRLAPGHRRAARAWHLAVGRGFERSTAGNGMACS